MSERRGDRAAWTAFIEGTAAPKDGKYRNTRMEFNGRKYDSIREATYASTLQMLEKKGIIADLQYQVRIVLVPGDGKLRPIVYVADFQYRDEAGLHVIDCKGFKTREYRLKKKLAALLLGIAIEEV
jgi:hypothetical protein